jgi:hypothetical protein
MRDAGMGDRGQGIGDRVMPATCAPISHPLKVFGASLHLWYTLPRQVPDL